MRTAAGDAEMTQGSDILATTNALTAAPRPRLSSRAPHRIASVAAIFGALLLVAATTGPWPGLVAGVQTSLIPDAATRGALRGVALGLSIGLLALARGLARRQRRAWAAALVLCAAATVIFLLRDVDVASALVAVSLIAVLVHWRADFYAAASARRPLGALAAAALALVFLFTYGTLAVLTASAASHQTSSVAAALRAAAWGMAGQDIARRPDEFSRGLVATLTIATVLTLGALAVALLRPPVSGSRSSDQEWREARDLVTVAGADSLAYFALRRDKRYFFDRTRSAFLAYRAEGGIAVVSGDPIGDASCFAGLLDDFAAHCRRQAWRPAVIGVGRDTRAAWEGIGLKTLYVGDEAVVSPAAFSLEGRAMRKVRQSVNRLERLGYHAEMRRAGELDEQSRRDVARVSEIWRDGQPERGFSMALDDVASSDLDDTLFVLGRDAQGDLAGFLHFVPVPATGDLSLSAMRRLPETPNGFNEFLVSSLLGWAGERGVPHVSLNFAVFGALLRDESPGATLRLARGGIRFADRFFQLERLVAFNKKFAPEWQPRYLALQRLADLPAVAYVVLHLENLLPAVLTPGAGEPSDGSAVSVGATGTPVA